MGIINLVSLCCALSAKDLATFYSKVSSGWVNVQADLFLPWVHILFGSSTVRKVSDCRYVPNCRFRGREFDPGLVPYFRGD